MDNLAPILVFVYNRLSHTQKLIQSLQQNEFAKDSDLFIYSDGAKSGGEELVRDVRDYIRKIDGFKSVTIVERDSNWGLARNIIDGVTERVNQFEKVIVLEDDLVVSPYFIFFMNKALNVYQTNEKIGHIHACAFFDNGALPDTFLIKWVGSWGWATWKRAWRYFEPDGVTLLKQIESENRTREFDFNYTYKFTKMLRNQIKGKNNSWAVRWYATLFLRNILSVNAGKSLVYNEGFDGSGTHCGNGAPKSSDLYLQKITVEEIIPAVENQNVRKAIEKYYKRTNSRMAKAIRRVKTIFK